MGQRNYFHNQVQKEDTSLVVGVDSHNNLMQVQHSDLILDILDFRNIHDAQNVHGVRDAHDVRDLHAILYVHVHDVHDLLAALATLYVYYFDVPSQDILEALILIIYFDKCYYFDSFADHSNYFPNYFD